MRTFLRHKYLEVLRGAQRPSWVVASVVFCVLGWSPAARALTKVTPEVVAAFPHDAAAFTQGLIWQDGQFFESTGLFRRSTLRLVDVKTGEVKKTISLPAQEFGEGLAKVGDRLIQLTWKNGLAHVYNKETFELIESFTYTGEGWGLCFDGSRLVMSDGSDTLFFRDPASFQLLGSVRVTLEGQPITQLNELECVGGEVLANVWQTQRIVHIAPDTGEVLTDVLVEGLLTAEEAAAADVLNGIAFDPATGHFFLSGKLWPRIFEVKLALNTRAEPAKLIPSTSPKQMGDASKAGSSAAVELETEPKSQPKSLRRESGCAVAPAPRREWWGWLSVCTALMAAVLGRATQSSP